MVKKRSVVATATSVLIFGLYASTLTKAKLTVLEKHHLVELRVFYRAFWLVLYAFQNQFQASSGRTSPACQWFVGDPLLKLMQTEEYRNVINLNLIPAAGMKELKDGTITCEAGPLECMGHRWEVCAMDKDRHDVVKYLSTVACIEGDESGPMEDWPTKVQNCVTDEERVVIQKCFDEHSEEMLRKMIREERSGSVLWMPYTVVNQNVLGSATEGVSLYMLKKSICSAYTGPKSFYPAECGTLVEKQKVLAPEALNLENALLVASGKNSTDAIEAQAPAKSDAHEGTDGKIGVDATQEMSTSASPTPPTMIVVAGKVQLQIIWRAFCPGCISFITKPLISLTRNRQFQEIIDFDPVPAAGTFVDLNGNFVCTGGKMECLGHKWLSCAINEFHQVGEMVEHIACMESKDNKGMTWSSVITRCFEGEDHAKMKTCFDVKSHDLLQKVNVVKRKAQRAPWVPYVLINGVPLGDSAHGIGLKQLADAVCKAYSGPKSLWPAACQPQHLRAKAEIKTVVVDEVIKPCAPKIADTSNAGTNYDDPPSIGKPLSTAAAFKTITESEVKVFGGNQAEDDDWFGAIMTAVVLPGVCFVALVCIALRLTRDHKKDA
ncbi:hypothetical protein CCR75_002086 [Bremia lactucae]|uniref:Gamma-interferon inducible lysosomal thiol reductase n=1 Tax=Bremia lactucae TaxID=4779 RepID=A0A976IKW3_BRELC|nr:hypothetical protein CCR75_002086 [Bremia lactucae]